jgi:nucleoside-diphosphate-sugar epimerase
MRVLVAVGAGYIGGHTALALMDAASDRARRIVSGRPRISSDANAKHPQ